MAAGEEIVTGTEVAFRGRLLTLRVDQVRLPDGVESRREIVEHRGAACVVPVASSGEVQLVRQFRLAVNEFLLEVPAGLLEEGEDPSACAARELEEETGFRAGALSSLGVIYPSPGYSTEQIHAFLATELEDGVAKLDSDERLEVVTVAPGDIERMIDTGAIRDGKTIASLLLALRRPHADTKAHN